MIRTVTNRQRISGFKIQLKAMFLDGSLNSVATVLGNLYQSFYEAAVRCLEYARALSKGRTMCPSVLISEYHSLPKHVLKVFPNGKYRRGRDQSDAHERPSTVECIAGPARYQTTGTSVLTSVPNNCRDCRQYDRTSIGNGAAAAPHAAE
jgi:hypothetical protein